MLILLVNGESASHGVLGYDCSGRRTHGRTTAVRAPSPEQANQHHRHSHPDDSADRASVAIMATLGFWQQLFK